MTEIRNIQQAVSVPFQQLEEDVLIAQDFLRQLVQSKAVATPQGSPGEVGLTDNRRKDGNTTNNNKKTTKFCLKCKSLTNRTFPVLGVGC